MKKGKEIVEQKPIVWTPEDVRNLLKELSPYADKFLTHRRQEAQADDRYLRLASEFNRTQMKYLAIFLLAIVGLVGFLTFLDKVSGDALLFLAGTVTGYVIVFIQRLIVRIEPTRPVVEE